MLIHFLCGNTYNHISIHIKIFRTLVPLINI